MTVLAIDQGTTSTRAFLMQPSGEMRQVATLSHRQIYPAPDHVEHDAEELLSNLRACLDAGSEASTLRAVGIDNQGESCLAWDAETGRAITPVIVWQDGRTAPQVEGLRAEGCEAEVRVRAGLPLDPYFSASKLGWIVREVPEARRLLGLGRLRLGTTDAFFRDRLTGRFETDVTTASRTSLMSLSRCTWDAELCRMFGVPIEALPAITPSTGDLGGLTGVRAPVALTASLVDQQAALYGHGCRRSGDAKITFGTGAFALAVTGDRAITGGTAAVPTVAWQKAGEAPVYALDGAVFAASSAVNWAQGLGLVDDLNDLRAFGAASVAARGLVFVPALAGLGCPHWDRAARGAWMGLTLDTSRAEMMQALLEGVTFRMAEVVADMARALPLDGPLSVDGGMSRNAWFCQMLADVLGRQICVSDEAELTALGTAQLAAEGADLALNIRPAGRLIAPRPLPEAARLAFARARDAVQAYGGGSV